MLPERWHQPLRHGGKGEAEMIQNVHVPGFEGRQIAVQPAGMFSSSRLFLDGQPAPAGPKRGHYSLRRNDGREVPAHFKSGFPDPAPVLVVDGQPIRLAEPLAWYEWVWAGFPLLLILVGGAIGGGLGALAMTSNVHIFRSGLHAVVKYALSALVSLACIAVWLAIVLSIRR